MTFRNFFARRLLLLLRVHGQVMKMDMKIIKAVASTWMIQIRNSLCLWLVLCLVICVSDLMLANFVLQRPSLSFVTTTKAEDQPFLLLLQSQPAAVIKMQTLHHNQLVNYYAKVVWDLHVDCCLSGWTKIWNRNYNILQCRPLYSSSSYCS